VNNACHRYVRKVAFQDTDASGWVHFTKLLAYAEEAEHDYLRKCGIAVITKAGGGWPRVNVACDFRSPLIFQDSIEVILAIAKIGESSAEWRFEISKDDKVAASGTMITVKVDGTGKPEAITTAERKLLEGGE
jgi:YbgC/YbaW family acyl-CoA thioester hydrolase